MKLKMIDILNIKRGLNEIGKLSPPMADTSLDIFRIGKKINPEIEALTEAEQITLTKYAKQDENGQPVRLEGGAFDIPDAVWNDFEAERKALMLKEIDVDISPIKWTNIKSMKDITSNMLELLEKVIEFE